MTSPSSAAQPAADIELLRLRLPHGADAPALARDAVALLAGRIPGDLDNARLLASELVTNAVCHGRPLADGGGIEMTVTRSGALSRLTVTDGGAQAPPAVSAAVSPGASGGRGLRIVDAVAGRWGYRWSESGTAVWCEPTAGAAADRSAAAAGARLAAHRPGSVPAVAVLGELTGMSGADRIEYWEGRGDDRRLAAAAAAYDRGQGAAHAGVGIDGAIAAAESAGTVVTPAGGAVAVAVLVGASQPQHAVVAALTRCDGDQALAGALVPAAALLGGEADTAPAPGSDPVLGELSFLAEASHLLASSLDYDETLGRVARLFVPDRADWVTVNVIEDDGSIRRVAVEHRDPAARPRLASMLDKHPHDPDAGTGVPRVLRTGEPMLFGEVSPTVLEQTANDPEYYEITRDLEIRSCIIVPLVAQSRVLGTMSLVSTDPARLRFDKTHLTVAEDVGRRAGLAIANARRYRDRSYLAAALQRTLLPDELPDVPGMELAVRYVPALVPSEVGGDFYDVVRGSHGEWYLLVGDVQGKGPDAATLIGLARHTLRTSAMRSDSPAAALRTLNRALLESPSGRTCTAICVRVVSVRDRSVATVARAGHPAPFLVRVARAVRGLEPDGLLLGVRRTVELEETTTSLLRGDALVLYTDGLYGRDDAGAEERLAATLGGAVGSSAEELATAALSVAGAGSGVDDVTVLVARVR